MTLPRWPARFRLPLRVGSGHALPKLTQTTDFAQGDRSRPLYEDGSDPFDNLAVILDGRQVDQLKGLYRYELFNGAGWLVLPLNVNGTVVEREVKFTREPTFEPLGPRHFLARLPVKTRYGTTVTREEYEELVNGPDFGDFVQTLLIPSDTAVLKPITGDAAPIVPVPWLGLWLPFGARISLEGADGGVAPLDLLPGTWFKGLVPRRLLARGTDADAVVYGLSHPSVTSLPDNAGDRVLHVVLSDTVDFVGPAVGGIYSAGGGAFRYVTAGGTADATIAPKTWLADPAAVITRINATGTGAEFSALAFVRARSIPLAPLMFGDDGEALQFTNDGSPLAFGS